MAIAAAADKMFPRKPLATARVEMQWACEKEASCQRMLRDTFSVCCFGDIMEMGNNKRHLYCHTHERLCPVRVTQTPGSALPSRICFESRGCMMSHAEPQVRNASICGRTGVSF